MENLNNHTQTELLKIGNDIKAQHDVLKQVIIIDIDAMEKLENSINEKVQQLGVLEKEYVKIIETIEKITQ